MTDKERHEKWGADESSAMEVAVTGATGGIGHCVVEALVAQGYQVLPLSRSEYEPATAYPHLCRDKHHIVLAHGTDDPKRVMDINYSLTRSVINKWVNHGKKGRCIVISSRQALIPSVREERYASSKAAIQAFCKALYANGANITCLCPGWVKTSFQEQERIAVGVKRPILPSEIADLVCFLLFYEHVRVPEILMEPSGEQRGAARLGVG